MEDKITKAKKIINIVDKIKGTFFLTAIILLLFVFLGGKVWGEMNWFIEAEPYFYIVLFFMLIAVIVINVGKVFLVMYHNSLVRRNSKEGKF